MEPDAALVVGELEEGPGSLARPHADCVLSLEVVHARKEKAVGWERLMRRKNGGKIHITRFGIRCIVLSSASACVGEVILGRHGYPSHTQAA